MGGQIFVTIIYLLQIVFVLCDTAAKHDEIVKAGQHFEKDLDIADCTQNPRICKNGGTCQNNPIGYICICVNGWTGNDCSINIDDCLNSPCYSGGTCHDQVGYYYCECPVGKTGLRCHLQDACLSNPCHAGSNCSTSPVNGDYICSCNPGWNGTDCSQNINECNESANSPCEHDGMCVDTPGSYRCDCLTGYTGPRCDIDINECASNPCLYGDTCLDEKGHYRCIRMKDGEITTYETTAELTQTTTQYQRDTPIRLRGGYNSGEGRVEIYHDGRWGTICDDSFDRNDARVICRMLGYYYWNPTAYQSARFGYGSGEIWLDNLRCNGNEQDISFCSSNGWGRHNCGHDEDASVSCYGDITTDEATTELTQTTTRYQLDTPIRLRGGYNIGEGRVEIYHDGRWGTICDDSFDRNDARVICRMLGYNYWNPTAYQSARFGHGSGEIWLDDLRCNGNERDISLCSSRGWGNHDCTHSEDACVSCLGHSTTYSTTPYYYWQTTTAKDDGISVYCNSNSWNVRVYLPILYQKYRGLITSDVYLGQDSCTGYVSGNYLIFSHSYVGCNTNITTEYADLIYSNDLIYAVHDPNYHFITREYKFKVNVKCHISAHETVSSNIKQNHGSVDSYIHENNASSHYTINMAFYQDSNFYYQKYGYPLSANIGEKIYVKVFTDIQDYNIKMRLSDCFTLPTPYASDNLKFYLIRNGCPTDPNTRILTQSTHETRFQFKDFEYSTNHENLYVYCNAKFCAVNDYSYSCNQGCHHKRRTETTGNDTSVASAEAVARIKQLKRNIRKRSIRERLDDSMKQIKMWPYTLPVVIGISACACVIIGVLLIVHRFKVASRRKSEII